MLDDGAQYLYGAGLDAMKRSGAWYYYLADGLGSTLAMVDSAGAVQKSYTYDVYGKPTATGTQANEFDFASQQADPTGLEYLRARYMDPETGRFISREPLAIMSDWGGNPFGYADGSPTSKTDPTGAIPGPTCSRDERWRDIGDVPGCRPPESGGGGPGTADDPFRAIKDAWKLAQDIQAWFLVDASRLVLGEYWHKRLRNCSMDQECRSALDNLFNAKTILGPEIAAILTRQPEIAIVVAITPSVWTAYKRVYDDPMLRDKIGD